MQEKTNIFQSLFFIVSLIVGLYPFISGLNQEWKVAGAIFFGLGIWSYLQFIFKDWITAQIFGSKEMEKVFSSAKKENQKIKEELMFIRGWMSALNHFKKDKKGFVDPITLIVIVIIVIIIILILKGKI